MQTFSIEIRNDVGQVIFVCDRPLRGFMFEMGTDLSRGVFEDQILEGAWFDDVVLREANFKGADLYWARFFRTDLCRANFENADLRGATFEEADLRAANFRFARLGRDNLNGVTNLNHTDLRGVDFRSAMLDGAVFEGAVYNETTRFPASFRPADRGMILGARGIDGPKQSRLADGG